MTSLTEFSDHLAGLVASAAPRLVAIIDPEGNRLSGIIWRTGLVVTAHEGLGGEEEVGVTLADGSVKAATIAGRDPTTDVALIRVETGPFEPWLPAPVPAVGSLAVVVGRSEHSALAALGPIAEVGAAWRSMRGGEIDARITLGLRLPSGAEGGAVLAPNGDLIGMAVTGVRRSAIVIPASTVDRAVALLAEKGYIPRSYLGVSLHPLGTGAGVIVVGLEGEGPAAKGGFLVGDIITTWDGEHVTSVGDLHERLSRTSVGQKISLGVERGGSASAIDLIVGERPRR